MSNPTSNEKTSKHSKSAKQSDRANSQLARRKKGKSEVAPAPATVADRASAIEAIPASTLPPVENVHVVVAETTKPVEILPELQLRTAEQAQRKMLGKVKRAFLKAGVEAGPEAQADFLNNLLMANVPVLNRSSGRIARVVKKEKSVESLLLARVRPKSA